MQMQLDQLMTEVTRARFRERRAEMREPFTRPVSIYFGDDETLTAFSKNLSRQGIAIVSTKKWETGNIATVRIHSLDGRPLNFRCECRWCEAYGEDWFQSGWKFLSAVNLPMGR